MEGPHLNSPLSLSRLVKNASHGDRKFGVEILYYLQTC